MQGRSDDRLPLPRPSARATATGVVAAVLRRVAPGLLVRIAARTADRGVPPFVDLLRIVEIAGALPATDPSTAPAGILARYCLTVCCRSHS